MHETSDSDLHYRLDERIRTTGNRLNAYVARGSRAFGRSFLYPHFRQRSAPWGLRALQRIQIIFPRRRSSISWSAMLKVSASARLNRSDWARRVGHLNGWLRNPPHCKRE